MPRFDEEDDEIVDLLKQYERHIISDRTENRDFDEWLEDEYGTSKKKAMKPQKKGRTGGKGGYE
jgi:hypothetical protein